MPSRLVYTIHTKIELKGGKKKYPQMGAVIKDEESGHLFFNLEMRPWKEWDGKGYLFIPKKEKEARAAEAAATEEPPMEEAPW